MVRSALGTAIRPGRTDVIRVGTSGWSYEDWRGTFYPSGLSRGRFLEFYSRHFCTAEVNSTYYRMPTERMVQGLVEKTSGRVTFCVKASRHMTHDRDADADAYSLFHRAIAPLSRAGLLGAVLAQFPQSLKPDSEGRRTLELVRASLPDVPLVFEFRDKSWDDERVYAWMRIHGVGLCCVDAPPIRGLFPPVVRSTSSAVAYLRCHGRNAASWYRHEHAHERYDYRYSDEEVAVIAGSVRKLAGESSSVFVFYNNHFQAKAVEGARKLLRELG